MDPSRSGVTLKNILSGIELELDTILEDEEKSAILNWILAGLVDPQDGLWIRALKKAIDQIQASVETVEISSSPLKNVSNPGSSASVKPAGSASVEVDVQEEKSESVVDNSAQAVLNLLQSLLKLANSKATVESEDVDNDEVRVVNGNSRPTRPRKVLPTLGPKEQLCSFYVTFKGLMKSWGVDESSSLFREYFESSIMNNVEVKDMYWNVMRRHPTWKLDKVIPWLIEVVDKVYSEDVTRDFDRLCQGVSESVLPPLTMDLLPLPQQWNPSFQDFKSYQTW
jgi:hypothetical protein